LQFRWETDIPLHRYPTSPISHFFSVLPSTLKYLYSVKPVGMSIPAKQLIANYFTNVRSHCVTQCFPCCVTLPCSALPCVRLRLNVRPAILHRNCLLNHVVERKIERTVKRGSRGKHILGELRKRVGTGTSKRKPRLSLHTLKNSVWKRLWTCRKASGCDDKQSQNPQTKCGREGCTKSVNIAHVRICTSGIPTALLNSCLPSIRKSFNMHRFSPRSVRMYGQFLIHRGLCCLLVCLPLFLL
jgi:hypothetical protein